MKTPGNSLVILIYTACLSGLHVELLDYGKKITIFNNTEMIIYYNHFITLDYGDTLRSPGVMFDPNIYFHLICNLLIKVKFFFTSERNQSVLHPGRPRGSYMALFPPSHVMGKGSFEEKMKLRTLDLHPNFSHWGDWMDAYVGCVGYLNYLSISVDIANCLC